MSKNQDFRLFRKNKERKTLLRNKGRHFSVEELKKAVKSMRCFASVDLSDLSSFGPWARIAVCCGYSTTKASLKCLQTWCYRKGVLTPKSHETEDKGCKRKQKEYEGTLNDKGVLLEEIESETHDQLSEDTYVREQITKRTKSDTTDQTVSGDNISLRNKKTGQHDKQVDAKKRRLHNGEKDKTKPNLNQNVDRNNIEDENKEHASTEKAERNIKAL